MLLLPLMLLASSHSWNLKVADVQRSAVVAADFPRKGAEVSEFIHQFATTPNDDVLLMTDFSVSSFTAWNETEMAAPAALDLAHYPHDWLDPGLLT